MRRALSLGNPMPGAATLAVLIPVARERGPRTLIVGSPMRHAQGDRERLANMLALAVEPSGKAAAA